MRCDTENDVDKHQIVSIGTKPKHIQSSDSDTKARYEQKLLFFLLTWPHNGWC